MNSSSEVTQYFFSHSFNDLLHHQIELQNCQKEIIEKGYAYYLRNLKCNDLKLLKEEGCDEVARFLESSFGKSNLTKKIKNVYSQKVKVLRAMSLFSLSLKMHNNVINTYFYDSNHLKVYSLGRTLFDHKEYKIKEVQDQDGKIFWMYVIKGRENNAMCSAFKLLKRYVSDFLVPSSSEARINQVIVTTIGNCDLFSYSIEKSLKRDSFNTCRKDISKALRKLHRTGIILNNLSINNIVYHPDKREVNFIDFSKVVIFKKFEGGFKLTYHNCFKTLKVRRNKIQPLLDADLRSLHSLFIEIENGLEMRNS
ncbi:MAG: hypothetical protein Tsb0021_02320 [Chlamydiales bacterium]